MPAEPRILPDERLVLMQHAAELAGISEGRIARHATEQKLEFYHRHGHTYISVDELGAIYPEVLTRFDQKIKGTEGDPRNGPNVQGDAPGGGGTPSGGENVTQARVHPDSEEPLTSGTAETAASPKPVEETRDKTRNGTISLSGNAAGTGQQGRVPGANVLGARMGATRYAGLELERTVTPNRRGRDGQNAVQIYRQKTPNSIRRMEEEHRREIERLEQSYQQRIQQLTDNYETQIQQLNDQLNVAQQQIERLRHEKAQLTKERTATPAEARPEHGSETQQEVARLEAYLDEAVARNDRLSEEIRVLLDTIGDLQDLVEQIGRQRNSAQRRASAEREIAMIDRERLLEVINTMSAERASRLKARRETGFAKLQELITQGALDGSG